jgi:serine phosphatase RsbU (regulator of sigma subunit)
VTIRILIADDHSVVRQGLRMFLSLDPDLAVVGEAANGVEAVRLAETLNPDVVLMDLMMPVMSGLEATSEIRRKALPSRVIALTSVVEDTAVMAVIRAGAIGYLLKDTEAGDLRRAIKSVAAGHAQLSPQVAERLLVEPDARESLETLSAREAQVLRLAAQGLPDHEIAARLVVDEPVVRGYFADILDKLRFADQAREDLVVARQIQMSLLPETWPKAAGWEFAAAYQAARIVGGDLYDFVELPGSPQRIGVLVADVSGKGAAAALFMAHSRAIIRAAALDQASPALALGLANDRILKDNQAGLFVSAFYAVLEIDSGRLTYANAGHPRPLWWQASQRRLSELGGNGIVLGVSAEAAYEERGLSLAPGDRLVLYTDGVTEATNAEMELFGEARLEAALEAAVAGSPGHIVQAILSAVNDFGDGAPQADDFTLMAIQRLASNSSRIPNP